MAEDFLQFLKRPVLLEEVVEWLVRWVDCSSFGCDCRRLWQRKAR